MFSVFVLSVEQDPSSSSTCIGNVSNSFSVSGLVIVRRFSPVAA